MNERDSMLCESHDSPWLICKTCYTEGACDMAVRRPKYTQAELDAAVDAETEACAKLADHDRIIDFGPQPHQRGLRVNDGERIRTRIAQRKKGGNHGHE